MYSPIIPRENIIIPPTNSKATMREVHPSGIEWWEKYSTTNIIDNINPIVATINPEIVTNLRGKRE